jgi:PmbA protein
MNQEMYDLAQWATKTVKMAGADNCRVSIRSERFVEISYRQRKPENIKEASQRGLGVDIYVNGRYSSQSTSDLRKEALQDFLSQAVTATKLLAEDPYRTLPDPKYHEGRAKLDLGIRDAGYEAFSPGDRHTLVKAVEDACLAKGGPKVISVTAGQYDGRSEEVVLTSNGFEGYRESTTFGAGAEVTMQDEGDRRPNGYFFATSVKKSGLPAPEKIGAQAAMRTLDLLGAKKIKTETMPIIVENQNVGRILGGLLSAMSGRNIQQKQSFLADKKGEKIASERQTQIDEPLLVGGLGSRLFDGDGFAAKKRTMIDSGVLKDFFVDWYYSRKLNWEPTTGGSSNLVVPPGTRSVKEIMKDLGRGILITGFIGGNSNSTTGDSSVGILGRLFEKGEPTQAVAEMNIAGNHLQFWHKLTEVANDPWPYSSLRTPSLVFTDIVVSGV